MADSEGNVWVGRRRECATIAHASRRALVTVERVVDGNFSKTSAWRPARSPPFTSVPWRSLRGARPATLLDEYAFDAAFVAEYASTTRTDAGFAAWCEQYVGTSMLAAAE